MSGMEREYIRDRTLEGHDSARLRGKEIGGASVTDDDMLTFAIALKDKGVPVPEIANKLTIKDGRRAADPAVTGVPYRCPGAHTARGIVGQGPPGPASSSAGRLSTFGRPDRGWGPQTENRTSVSCSDTAHRRCWTAVSWDFLLEATTSGYPRVPPTPLGP